MTYRRAKEIFLEVCDLPADERRARVEEACAGDEELRRAVDALLEGDAAPKIETGGHLRAALGELLDEEPETERGWKVPETIDRYRVLRELGSGGMGVVYLAEQDSPRRRVAVKVLRAGLHGREYVARLRREAETLGRLQHPAIAQVHDAGVASTPGGALPFIAMEYVEGQPLLAYAEDAKLPTRARLELFVEICDAIHHAHQKGVIHRDLKPDNILVRRASTTSLQGGSSGIGRPVVLDFGIARIVDAEGYQTTLETRSGALLGTLPYMSPEQMMGSSAELDTRSDIYALGVILFQLLARRLPIQLEGATVPEMILRVQEDEPTRLGSVDRAFRGDLETIAGRALEKDPERRYPSAAELGAEVQRFLTNQPIVARPHSSLYQLQKFVRRNRGLAAGIASTLLALAGGLIASTMLYLDARAANVVAKKEASKALAIRDYILFDMLEAASPGEMGAEVRVVDLLDLAAPGVEAAFAGHPGTATAVRHTLASAYFSLGQTRKASVLHEEAWRAYEDQLGPLDPRALRARYDLARDQLLDSRLVEATEHLRAVAEAQAAGAEIEGVHRAIPELILAHLDARLGDPQGIERASAIVADVERALGERHETVMEMRGMHIKALALVRALQEAEELSRKQLDLLEDPPGEPSLKRIEATGILAQVLFLEGRHDEGRAIAEEYVASLKRTYGPDHLSTLVGMAEYGTMLSDVDDLDGAMATFDECLPELENAVGEDHLFPLQIRNNIAIVLRKQGRLKESQELAEEVIEGRRAQLGPDHYLVAQSLDVLAFAQRLQGDHAASLESYLEAESIFTAALGSEHWATLNVRFNLGALYEDLERYADAEQVYRDYLPGTRAVYGDEHPYVADGLYQIARMCRTQERLAEAEGPARQALEMRRAIFPADHYRICDAESLLGVIQLELQRGAEGAEAMRAAWDCFERAGRTERAIRGGLYGSLVDYYETEGLIREAADLRLRLGDGAQDR